MSVRVFRQALRQTGRALLLISLGAAAFYYLVLLSSASFLSEAALPRVEFFREPPRVFEAFLGGAVNFFEPSGWLSAAMTHPINLALMLGAAFAVASVAVSAEVERGTIDLVLARPVGRVPFLMAKAAASVAAVSVAHAGALAGALVARLTVERVDEVPLDRLLLAFLVSWVLFAGLAMVGLLVSSRSSLRGRAVGISVGIAVAWYFANFIAFLIDEISGIRYASPFHYFRPGDVLTGEAVAVDVLVLAGLAVVALGGALRLFTARDMTR